MEIQCIRREIEILLMAREGCDESIRDNEFCPCVGAKSIFEDCDGKCPPSVKEKYKDNLRSLDKEILKRIRVFQKSLPHNCKYPRPHFPCMGEYCPCGCEKDKPQCEANKPLSKKDLEFFERMG